jgi:hydrogenase expression/formation protein HypD
VVTGFEPVDILQAIAMLVDQLEEGEAKVEIQYTRAVSPEGNTRAMAVLNEVFEPCDAVWRGLGPIPQSGLAFREAFQAFDAARRFSIELPESKEPAGCACGDILRGIRTPPECRLFRKVCTPTHPIGPCMVSSEGTCAAYFKYSDA